MKAVNQPVDKCRRFLWRLGRNLLCTTPIGLRLLFPSHVLAARFGRDDADYAISVFVHHYRQLCAAGFRSTDKILEVGPGRNLGTALLMWAVNHSREERPVTVFLWDAFPNMHVTPDSLRQTAQALLETPALSSLREVGIDEGMTRSVLGAVACGKIWADVRYRVQPVSELLVSAEVTGVGLVYSQAAIEHVWDVAKLWRSLIGITRSGGWHSHVIDLADHGRRESNYIEMLEWSPWAYWLTMRFIPGAVNRWRACQHFEFIAAHGLRVVHVSRQIQKGLPIPRQRIAQVFRTLPETELCTTNLDVVALKISVLDDL